jgi:hypothetical protein
VKLPWEPEAFTYLAPTITYYTPTGLAFSAEIAKLTRTSTINDHTHYYRKGEIRSSAVHLPVTVLIPVSRDDSLNRFYVGTGLYLDTIIEANLYGEHDMYQTIHESILDEYGPVVLWCLVAIRGWLVENLLCELRYLMDLSEFSASALNEYNLRTQSLMLRLGLDLTKYNLD